MKIRVRYFAALREALGAQQELQLPPGAGSQSVGAARALLQAGSPRHAELLAPGRAVRCALNQQMCDEAALLQDGDELAFFPPVTGG